MSATTHLETRYKTVPRSVLPEVTWLRFPERSKLPASSLELGSNAAKTLVACGTQSPCPVLCSPCAGARGLPGLPPERPAAPLPREAGAPTC